MTPRLRFAPSPTGSPHIGNLHTALFSWALARSLNGDFILRIEDTDPERNLPQAQQELLDALQWLGIDWDEGPDIGGEYGPYLQSQRRDRHQEAVELLLARNQAYYGDEPDSPAQSAAGQPLRLRMPPNGQTIVQDALRGPVIFDNARLEDKILVRSDGRPLYHLAAMVDDHEMAISHVVRGEEWLSSAPYHVQLYRALGWQEPVWVHLPLIVNRQGEKLKKRDPQGSYLVSNLRQAGYLPEALWNYLLLLGWAPDKEQELVSKWDVRQQFRVERLSTSPSTFDWEKLNWINRQYLARHSDKSLAGLIQPYLEDSYGAINSEQWLIRLAAAIRSDLTRLADAPELAHWAFSGEIDYSGEAGKVLAREETGQVLVQLVASLARIVLLDEETAAAVLQDLQAELQSQHGWSRRQVLLPIRAALTGRTGGPALAAVMALLGAEQSMQRLAAALRSRRGPA